MFNELIDRFPGQSNNVYHSSNQMGVSLAASIRALSWDFFVIYRTYSLSYSTLAGIYFSENYLAYKPFRLDRRDLSAS